MLGAFDEFAHLQCGLGNLSPALPPVNYHSQSLPAIPPISPGPPTLPMAPPPPAPPADPSLQTRPETHGKAYYTRDLLTDPPTVVQIVSDLPTGATGGPTRTSSSLPVFAITFADIEPTAGWLSDRNNASLDICFMHSFGKCSGKAKEKDPRTCHQIHVRREVLLNLRSTYVNPQRNYFCRTMKANITEKFAQVLSLLARRRFTLQYLEFKTDDIDVTSGSTAYEVQYRHWLVSDPSESPQIPDRRPPNANTDNFISTSCLCWDFAITGRCSKGATCPDLHGHVDKALTKDRFVRQALEEMSKKDGGGETINGSTRNGAMPETPHHRAQQQQQQPKRFTPAPASNPTNHNNLPLPLPSLPPPPPQTMESQSFQLPSKTLPPSFMFGDMNTYLPPPPPPLQQHQQQISLFTPSQSQSLSMPPNPSATPSSQGNGTMPFFVVSEGSDNVLRLVPLSAYTQFGSN